MSPDSSAMQSKFNRIHQKTFIHDFGFLENCHRRCFKLKNQKLNTLTPYRKQQSVTSLTLGKPYGIQLGTFDITSDYFPSQLRGKQALDTLLVAHGMTYVKRAIHWTQQDIDNILMLGAELLNETSAVKIDKLSQLTKGFTHEKHFIQVTMSEPVVVGKVMTLTDRSMDLRRGLNTFFSQHQQGILQTPTLDLYIINHQVFYVFDPRGRTMDCERDANGEAALIVLGCMSNLYHLILNMSNLSVNSPFKISTVAVTQMMSSRNTPDKFTAVSGNPSRVCRSADYKFIDDQIAFLKGNLHLGSKVFGILGNRQQLATSIMTMVYAKIDPPNSWSSSILDRVLHFGTKFCKDCLEAGPVRNLTLPDIPSKFYVGEVYRVSIAIVPFLRRVELKSTRIFCDNPIMKALKDIFETSSFRCLLLQIDNYSFAVWQMKSTEMFYFYDGYQKDIDGNRDLYEGTSTLFMIGTVEKLCALVISRLLMAPRSEKATLDIHGMKITELTKLNDKEMKRKSNFKLIKKDCIKPLSTDIATTFADVPSNVDSVAPVLTASKILTMREKLPEKPQNLQVVNSPPKVRSDFSPETVAVILDIHSEILNRIVDDKISNESLFAADQPEKVPCKDVKDEESENQNCCGKFVTYAEKVWLTTDLEDQEPSEHSKEKVQKRPTQFRSGMPSLSNTSSEDEFEPAETSPFNSTLNENQVVVNIHLFNTSLLASLLISASKQ